MSRVSWKLGLILAAALFLSAGTQRASAQGMVVIPATTTYYPPAPVVSYYSAPVVYPPVTRVSYYAPPPPVTYIAPTVSYYAPPPVTYAAPAVSYYPPTVSYYAPPVTAVTTTRYGIFGQPRSTSTYYYPR
jgi:hypothetical protein